MQTSSVVPMLVLAAACGSGKPADKPCKRGATIEARRVDNGAPFSKAMYARAEAGNVGGKIDQWTSDLENENGLPVEHKEETDYYVTAASREALEKFVASGEPVPADRAVGYQRFIDRGEGYDPNAQWRTYLLMKDSPISADVISGVSLGANPVTKEPQLGFTMTDKGKQAFAAFTKTNAGKKVAFLVGGEVLMAPIIDGPISGGMFTMPVPSKSEADALMAKLACTK